MKRLLILINDAHFFNTTRLPVAIAAKDAGYDVHVASSGGIDVETITSHGITHHTLTLSRSGTNLLSELFLFVSIIRLFTKLSPDIAHCITIKPSLYGGLAARLTRCPSMIVAISGLGTTFLNSGLKASMLREAVVILYKIALSHKNCFTIFQNPSDKKLLIDANVINEKNARLLAGSGIDLSRFVVAPEPRGRPRVLFAARLLKDKGIREFVEAAKLTLASGFDADFIVAGDIDPDNPTSLTQLEKDEITKLPNFNMLGTQVNMEDVYAQSTIVVLPSYREGLPRVLCEAAACGRATITTDVPGCRDAIIEGKTGLLVPVRDSYSLSVAIKKLLQNLTQRHTMATAGRQFAEDTFDVKSIADAHLQLYADLLSRD